MMLLAVKKAYEELRKARAKSKGTRILIMCYNEALKNYLEVRYQIGSDNVCAALIIPNFRMQSPCLMCRP